MAKELMTKNFSVFDCDSHIVEPGTIWSDYVEPEYRDAVKAGFWKEDEPDGTFKIWLNGELSVHRKGQASFFGAVSGPGMSHELVGKLRMGVDPHPLVEGSYDPHARLRDLDLLGIDQVMLFPTFCGMWFTSIEDPKAAKGMARAYNNWVLDYSKTDPKRMFPAGIVPVHNNEDAIEEIGRLAKLGFKCIVTRPNIVAGRYPANPSFDPIWEAIADHGMIAGMHPFPAATGAEDANCSGTFVDRTSFASHLGYRGGAGEFKGITVSESLCFGFDAQIILMNMFHFDFFVKHPKLKFAIFESNAAWLPALLEKADGRVVVWEATRGHKVTGKPSEIFHNGNNWIGFESDEKQVFEQWQKFENIGTWAGDYPHLDAEDAWEGIEHMQECGVPEAVQAKLMGGNARAMYEIEPVLCVTKQADVPPVKLAV